MLVTDILESISNASGTNEKAAILKSNKSNVILVKALELGHDSYTPFNVVKVPAVLKKQRQILADETARWHAFFEAAGHCASRTYTGNAAISLLHSSLSTATEAEEAWMRKILKKNMSLGASTKTINKVIPGLISTFEVALAQKFDIKRIHICQTTVSVEPKLDGIRCFAIVQNNHVNMFARSGKLITNFNDTIGEELIKLGDGCYDGEIMGDDFTALMRQARRKYDVDVKDTYLCLFDYLPLTEWESKKTILGASARYEELDRRIKNAKKLSYIRCVPNFIVPANYKNIKELHDTFVSQGYEGAMVKDNSAPYLFGRGYEVMKFKEFFDADLEIEGFTEGTGKHSGKLGAVIVKFNGVEVQVGSGFNDELREQIWDDKDSFLGRIIEVRYQEITPDGSLRFPTFKCFRNDR